MRWFLVAALIVVAVGCSEDLSVSEQIPPGVVAAMPFQNRVDVAKGIFQVKVFNGTDETLDVAAVQLVWAGMTTPVSERSNAVGAGGRVDFPVALAPARCAAAMPTLTRAVVRMRLADGSERDVPVYDAKGVARRLYEADCERQRIESLVAIEWVDLHEATFEGRPVTEGVLRLTRRAATGVVRVTYVSNTINFTVDVEPVTLTVGADSVEVPVRFREGRCDAHALSESSQPFRFVAIVDLGDGVEHGDVVTPPVEEQVPMRRRVERGCAALGAIDFVGQGASS